MAKKKSNSYHTIDELLEQQRQNAYSSFSVGDDKEYHTIDEIKEAAVKQGLLRDPNQTNATQPSAQTPSGRRNLMIATDQLKRRENEYLNEIGKYRVGLERLSNYDNNTRYSDVSNDISRVKSLKGGAARRGKDTEVYDMALEMLKGYATQRYSLDNPETTDEDKQAIYDENKREIANIQNQLKTVDNKYTALKNMKPDGTYDISKSDGQKELENRLSALSAQNKAIETEQNNKSSESKSVEELQKEIDAPQKTIDDIDLNDEETVSAYLNHDREAVDFFMNYRRNNLDHNDATEARYQNLLNTIEVKVNNANEANSNYNTGEDIGYTDSYGRKYNKQDYLIGRVAQNQAADITADAETAKSTLSEISDGNRDLTNAKSVSGDALKSAGWDVSGDITNYGQAYSSKIHDTAAVFSPVLLNESGEVERILTPSELEQYANNVLSGAGDTWGLKMTDTYYGANAESLANENQQRIRRLSERYYNDTDLKSLMDAATVKGTENETMHNELAQASGALTTEEARDRLAALGVNADNIETYQDLQNQKKFTRDISKAYADWSASNGLPATVATAGNIVTSPIQALEWLGNLGESLTGHFAAGTNTLSASNLPNIDNDTVTSLSRASTGSITNAIRDNIKGNGDNDFLNQLGDLAADTYGGVTSGIQSFLTVATCYALLPEGVAEWASLAIMSGEAGNQAYYDVIENGGTTGQAVTYSVASAVNETLGEKISLDHMLSVIEKSGKQTAKEMIVSMLTQSLIEGSEEIVTEDLNEFADRIVNGDKSTYYQALQQYLDMGYSEEEAKSKASTDFYNRVISAGYGGFVGGLIGGGGAAVLSNAQNNYRQWRAGQSIASSNNIQNLVNQANQLEGADAVKALAREVVDLESKRGQGNRAANWLNEKKIVKKAGKLYAGIQEQNAQGIQNARETETKDAIRKAYAQQTGEDVNSDTVKSAADAIYKSAYTSEKLTDGEKALVSSEAAQSAIETIKSNRDVIESDIAKKQERNFKNYVSTAQLAKEKTDTDIDIDEFNTHEDDEKVYNKDSTEQLNVKDIASVGRGDITVQLENGQTESVKNLNLPVEDATLYKGILDMQDKSVKGSLGIELTPEIANTIYRGYKNLKGDKMSISAYIEDAKTVLYNGYVNNTAIDNSIKIPQSLRNTLYKQGSQLASTHTLEQQKSVKNRVQGNRTRKGNATFKDGIKRSQLDARRRAGVNAVEKLAESLGFDVVFYRSTKDGKGRFSSEYLKKKGFVKDGQQAPSGFWRGGKMYIDVNAGMNGEGLILFTASHELVHMIKEGSPEDFKALADFLVQNYVGQGVDVNDLIRAEMARSTNLTRDEAFEEVIAESAESFLKDTNLNGKAQELYKQNRSLWSRIREALKRIINAIKETYVVAKPQSNEARLTARTGVEQLEKAYDLWIKGIIKSAENLRNMESESTDTKYQGRAESQDAEYLDAVERGDMETAQRMVDEAAERAFANSKIRDEDGKLLKMYHGTSADFTVFDVVKYGGKTGTAEGLGINLIDRKEGASGYGERVIESYVNITKPAKTWEKTITRNDLVKLIRKSAETEARRMVEEDEYGSVNEALKDTWISNYVNTYEYSNIEDAYKEVADTVLRYNTNDRDIVWEVVNGSGANYSNENWIKFYNDILEPTIGIDGFWTTWAAKDGKKANVVIAFDSSQVKSATPVTYDDNGNVIPLSERFNESNKDIRYQSRNNDVFSVDDMFDDDSIESTFAKEYVTHYEDIGEVLQNISDIDIAPTKVTAIVNRVLRENFGNIDKNTRELLSTEIQIALDQVNRDDSATVMKNMTDAVRSAISDAYVVDENAEANYKDLLSVFKGKRFYLTDEQIADLKEHDMTLADFKNRMFGYRITIANRDNLERGIDGRYKNAQQLSLEGLHENLESLDEYLDFRADQWDEMNYHAPIIIMNALDDLSNMRKQRMSEVYSNSAIDDIAVNVTAQITGGIVEAKYNSKKNPYVSKLVNDLRAKRTEAVKQQKEKNKQKLAELKQKERERAEKREQELKQKYQEQRDRTRESRKRTEFRSKVKQLIGSFNTVLTHPVEGKYIPRGFISQTIDVLNAINIDSGRSERISAVIADLKVKYEKLKQMK